jgi:hypothetical protein
VAAVDADTRAEPAVSSRALLLLDVEELMLALPGDDADLGPSNNEEISTVAASLAEWPAHTIPVGGGEGERGG